MHEPHLVTTSAEHDESDPTDDRVEPRTRHGDLELAVEVADDSLVDR